MNQTQVELIFGSALHDLGKVIQRASKERVKHAKLGADFIRKYIDNQAVNESVRYHHARELAQANLPASSLAYITYVADNIASGIDRRLQADVEETTYRNWDTYQNQEDIFNAFGEFSARKRYYQPVMLDDRMPINFAKEKYLKFSSGKYAAIVTKIQENLGRILVEEDYLPSLVSLLESTMSYVPSSTNLDEVADISLYDHLKITTAIATCIYQWLESQEIQDYKAHLFDNSRDFYQEEAFALASFDISGIQKFIYTIKDQRAAKMLRSRSFYLEMFAEHLIDHLLDKLKLSRFNLLYSGGGNAYFLFPNTPEVQQGLKDVSREINAFLQKEFQEQLFVAFAATPCTGQVLMGTDEETSMGHLYQELSRQLGQQKMNRYTAEDILALNEQGKQAGRECVICLAKHQNERSDICDFCQGLIDLSAPLQTCDFLEVSQEKTKLPLGFGHYLRPMLEEPIHWKDSERKIYAKNKYYIGYDQNTHLWVGDYTDRRTFNDYAGYGDLETRGIQRLGVLRCDVDDLGEAFIAGFSSTRHSTGKTYQTLSRSMTFSRSMSLFFQFYINRILQDLDFSGTIIYAGGDDVFLVGAWYDIIEAAITIRENFLEYSQGKLTLSSGIGIFPNKTPVTIMAEETGGLEDAAKYRFNDQGELVKDSVALFSKDYVFGWDQFIQTIWKDKLPKITEFFTENQFSEKYGKAFIYNLLQLIRDRQEEQNQLSFQDRGSPTISWARWAYFLSRMEPSDEEQRQAFKVFAKDLHQAFADEESIREIEVALIIYLYTIREGV